MGNLADLENRRSDLAVRRGDQNAELVAVDARIAAIERQLGAFATTYEQALAAQVASLDRTLEGTGRRLAGIPTRQAQSARLERRASLVGELHRVLQTRLQEAEVAQGMNLPNVSIIDAASRPLQPASPNVPLNLGLGMALGLGLGVSLVFLREHGDTRIHERQALEQETGLPILGMLPSVRDAGPVVPVVPVSMASDAAAHLPGPRSDEGAAGGASVIRHRRRSSLSQSPEHEVVLEAFRSLGTDLKLIARRPDGGALKSVMITSSGQGKARRSRRATWRSRRRSGARAHCSSTPICAPAGWPPSSDCGPTVSG